MEKIKKEHKGSKNLVHFKKGVSGNPKGRPKGSETCKDLIDRFGKLAIAKDKNILKLTMDDLPPDILKEIRTVKQLIIFRYMLKAASGDSRHAEYIIDRLEGKAPQFIAHTDLTPQPLFEDDNPNNPFGFADVLEGEIIESESESPTEKENTTKPKTPEQCGGGNGC